MSLDIKKYALVILFSLILITIISTILSQFSNIPVIKTGGAFILVSVSVIITYIFIASMDRKIDRKEIITMIVLVIVLAGGMWAIHEYMPQIFSALPNPLKQVFSTLYS